MREAVVRVPDAAFAAMGLAEMASLIREGGLVDVTQVSCHGPGGVVALSFEQAVPEERLVAADSVEWVERLAGDDPATYLLKVEVDGLEASQPEAVVSEAVTVETDGVELSLVGPREDLVEHVRELAGMGPGVALSRFTEYDGPRDALDVLTDRQREVLEAAHAAGYFDVPRGATVADVAAALGLDPSTVAEHIQRAERNLLGRLLAGG